MLLSLDCHLAYEVLSPRTHFVFHIFPVRDTRQQVRTESLTITPEFPTESTITAKGNRVFRLDAPEGPLDIRYQGVVEVRTPGLPPACPPDEPGRVALKVLTYLRPSRFCESDRLAAAAWDLFGRLPSVTARLEAIGGWVRSHITDAPPRGGNLASAADAWASRTGGNRDRCHLAIAFARALGIPARYAAVSAPGASRSGFHGAIEAWVGGGWHLLDAADGLDPDRLVVVARGRDEPNAATASHFGHAAIRSMRVDCAERADLPPSPARQRTPETAPLPASALVPPPFP